MAPKKAPCKYGNRVDGKCPKPTKKKTTTTTTKKKTTKHIKGHGKVTFIHPENPEYRPDYIIPAHGPAEGLPDAKCMRQVLKHVQNPQSLDFWTKSGGYNPLIDADGAFKGWKMHSS